jgi:beta-phosphoglucomutase
MQIKAVLWDMDGTLVDNGEAHYQAWTETLVEYQIPFSRELFHRIFGIPNQPAVELMIGKEKSDLIWQEIGNKKETNFLRAIHGTVQLLPGVLDWLQTLNEMNIPCAIASSSPMENIDAIVDDTDIRGYFKELVSGVGHSSKPDPWIFLEASRRVGVEAEYCLVVEDSIFGVKGAKAAGMRCLAVTTTNPSVDLLAAGADWVYPYLDQLDVRRILL